MSFDNGGCDWSVNETRMLRHMLEQDGLKFMQYFYKVREGACLKHNWHVYVIEYVLQAVLDCKVSRLIVNIAPGYTKTDQIVINFIARGLALNNRSKFIHTSYSGDLVQVNSSYIKDVIQSPEFQALWPMRLRVDSTGKKRWFTEHGGGMMAAPSGGQITGFRAGRMDYIVNPSFTGAFIIDDPLKPDDAFSATKRTFINSRFNNTTRSRLALEHIPILVAMQRLHEDDLSGYLLKGGSGDKWHHLSIPVMLSDEVLDAPYPEEYTHGIRIDLNKVLAALHGGAPYEF